MNFITPVEGDKNPAEVAADLRAIADLVETNPHLAAMFGRLFNEAMWPVHAAAHERKEDPRAVIAETVRQLKPLATGPVEKNYWGSYLDLVIPMRALRLRLTDERSAVCTRVVTGVETVTEEIPDPEYIAAAPKITQTREVEKVEWHCEPLMAGEQR